MYLLGNTICFSILGTQFSLQQDIHKYLGLYHKISKHASLISLLGLLRTFFCLVFQLFLEIAATKRNEKYHERRFWSRDFERCVMPFFYGFQWL